MILKECFCSGLCILLGCLGPASLTKLVSNSKLDLCILSLLFGDCKI